MKFGTVYVPVSHPTPSELSGLLVFLFGRLRSSSSSPRRRSLAFAVACIMHA